MQQNNGFVVKAFHVSAPGLVDEGVITYARNKSKAANRAFSKLNQDCNAVRPQNLKVREAKKSERPTIFGATAQIGGREVYLVDETSFGTRYVLPGMDTLLVQPHTDKKWRR